jgi:hypothetical protein
MTTFPNAPAPRSALFDDAPATQPQQPRRKTSDDYTPCIAMWPSGKTQRATVLYVRLDSVERARKKLGSGLVMWVRESDVEAVLEQGNGPQ